MYFRPWQLFFIVILFENVQFIALQCVFSRGLFLNNLKCQYDIFSVNICLPLLTTNQKDHCSSVSCRRGIINISNPHSTPVFSGKHTNRRWSFSFFNPQKRCFVTESAVKLLLVLSAQQLNEGNDIHSKQFRKLVISATRFRFFYT